MRVALLSHLASPMAPTGAERSLVTLASGLAARGHSVSVATPGRWMLRGELEAAGVAVVRIPVRPCWLVQWGQQPLWLQAARGLRYALPDLGARLLRQWLAECSAEVVHVNCLPHLRGAATAKSLGLPVVWHVREMMPPGGRRRWFARRLGTNADRIVAVSEAVAGWLRDEGLGERVVVIHNGVDAPDRLPDRDAARVLFGLPAEGTVIGLFGQLVAHKGAVDFVRAAHRMAEKNPNVWFLIAGHGPDAFVGELQRMIHDGSAAERIRVVPPQPEIWQLMAAVDVLALTTLWPDPLPRVVMEAMVAARPVVAYRGGGIPEMVVDGETGLLCFPADVEALSTAMGQLAEDFELRRRMGQAGARRARELFSVERHLDRMEEILESAVSSRR